MSDFNMGRVLFDFSDARRNSLKDSVRFTFDNFHLKSLNFRAEADRFPASLDLVAFPRGEWTVFIQPEHYRPKTLFISVPSGGEVVLKEVFLLDAGSAKPVFPKPDALFSEPAWKPLADLLGKSEVNGLKGQDLYTHLTRKEKLLAAGLLNLHARSQAVDLKDGNLVFAHYKKLLKIQQDRIFATVDADLHPGVLKSVKTKVFNTADGSLHEFDIPGDFDMLKKDASFKTPEKAGNFQLTFAKNSAGDMVVDADVDEAKGVAHAFEVLGHIFSGKRTHPYDIHQILTYFYEDIEPGYDLVPA